MGRGNPRAVTGTHTTPVGDELMVHVVGTAETHLLSPTTASVWQRCDGRVSRVELESVFADQPSELRPELVQLALDQLEKAGLVEDGGDSSDLQRESRRRFLRKAIVGAAIVPTVMTVTMQPAAAAHSPSDPAPCNPACGAGQQCLNGQCRCVDSTGCEAGKLCASGTCTGCAGDSQCQADSRYGANSYCASGTCTAKKINGSSCTAGNECLSGCCSGSGSGGATCAERNKGTCPSAVNSP